MKLTSKLTLATSLLTLGTLAANAQKTTKKTTKTSKTTTKVVSEYITRPDGLQYKYLTKGAGKDTPNVGYTAYMRLIFKSGDSVVINTDQMNNNNPIQQTLSKGQYKGDVMDGFRMMHKGDKVEFRILTDSLKAKMPAGQAQSNPLLKNGQYLSWTTTMVDFKSPEQVKKDADSITAYQNKIDNGLIETQLKNEGYTILPYNDNTPLQVTTTSNKIAYKDTTGLYLVVNKLGDGTTLLKQGENATVNYTGKLLSGDKFDSNTDTTFHHVEPFNVNIGLGRVIKGWDIILGKIHEGDYVTVYLPSSLAYGDKPAGPKIPANSVLVFDIERLKNQEIAPKTETKNNISNRKFNNLKDAKVIDAGTLKPMQKMNLPAKIK